MLWGADSASTTPASNGMVAGPAGMLRRGRRSDRRADLLKRLQTINVMRCDEAAWRFLGISLAGYNALIAATLAALPCAVSHGAKTAARR